MSLPSMITFFPSAIFLCNFTILSLTSFILDTCDTNSDTSLLLIFSVTSSPFKSTTCLLFSLFNSICIFSSISFILSNSSNFTPLLIMSNVTHLYVAPVSIFTSLNFFDKISVTVPFPVPAGPSIATINDIFSPSN